MSVASKIPTHRVYAVVDKAKAGTGEKGEIWLNIGVAFEHAAGNGFNVVLGGLPAERKLVMREISEGDIALFSKQQDARVRRWALFHLLDVQARRTILWVAGLLAVQGAIVTSILLFWR